MRDAFVRDAHHCMPSSDAYASALAVVSNFAIVTGRADSLRELKGKIDARHPVILVDVPSHPDGGHAWDAARVNASGASAPRTDDAIGYLRHQLAMLDTDQPEHMFPAFGVMTKDWLVSQRAEIRRLVCSVELTPGVPVDAAVQAIEAHLAATLPRD